MRTPQKRCMAPMFIVAVLVGLGAGVGLGFLLVYTLSDNNGHADPSPTRAPAPSPTPGPAPAPTGSRSPLSSTPSSAPSTTPSSAPYSTPYSTPSSPPSSTPSWTTTTAGPVEAGRACDRRDFGFGSFVCACNATFCDSLPPARRQERGKALLYVSTKAGLRMERQELTFSSVIHNYDQTLTVNRSQTYQTVLGFGGAFTDAAGINILALPDAAQDRLLRLYYSEDGLEYNIGRVPIGGTDFSTREYTYADGAEDPKLTSFQLQPEDLQYKIPLIQRAKDVMPASSGDLHLYSSIWSPPPWMKTSGKYSGFGFLREDHYQTYADYFIKFFEAYESHNLTFYCASTGNEPLDGIVPFKYFNSLGWKPASFGKWIKNNLGPTIRASKYKDIKIMGHDDQRILLPWEMQLTLADKEAASYIDIIGYHWYLNFITPSSILDHVHELWPDKPIVNSESCNGDKPWDFIRVQPGSWERGELYIDDIVEVMNHWTTSWIDWNLALNAQGGPTWAENWVDSPVIVDPNKGEFYLNPTFYALAHVTKFVPRGSQRIDLASTGGFWLSGKVGRIAFLRPDGGVSVILVNKHSSTHEVTILDPERGQLTYLMPAKSWATVVYW